jgi:hypothetical protein
MTCLTPFHQYHGTLRAPQLTAELRRQARTEVACRIRYSSASKRNGAAADRAHALHEERRREFATGDFVGQVFLGVPDPSSPEPVS